MDRWLLGFIVGAILSLLPPKVPALFYECLLIFVIIIGVLFKQWRVFACLCFGALWVLNHGDAYNSIWRDNEINSEQFFRQQHQALIEITDIPVATQTGLRFTGLIKKLEQQPLARPIKVRLSINNRYFPKNYTFQSQSQSHKNSQAQYHDDGNKSTKYRFDNLPIALHQGDVLNTKIKFKPAHGLANQGGFNYQRWLRANGIHATGYIVLKKFEATRALTKQSSQFAGVAHYSVDHSIGKSVREQLYQRVKSLTQGLSQQPLVLALLFGERSLFDEQTWQVLQATGTQHLVAISGLHVGLVVAIAYGFAKILIRVIPFYLLSARGRQVVTQRNSQFFLLSFSTLVTVFYCYLAGFSLPTVRALIFFLLFVISPLLPIRLSPTRLILLSVVVTIILIPSSVYSVSFWLSYLAVAAIMLVYWRFGFWLGKVPRRYPKVVKNIAGFMLIQIGIVILLMPVTALLFGQISTISVLANSVALPIVGLVVMPLLFIAMLLLAFGEPLFSLVANIANAVLEWLWLFLQWLSHIPSASLSLSSKQTLVICVLVLIGTLLAVFRFQRASSGYWRNSVQGKSSSKSSAILPTSVALGAIVLLSGYVPSSNRDWQVTVLDVGQGLAIVISKGDKAILYDTGNAYPSGWNLADQAVLPYLKYHGLTLDYFIVSHDDSDHAAGAPQVVTAYPDAKLIFNGELPFIVATKTHPCQQGQTLDWQGLSLTMLWPEKRAAEHNDDSCVVRISDGKASVLLTGDITKKVERQLIRDTSGLGLASDIVVAPHHGSKSSSSKDFIKHLNAKAVVFSAGYLNQWKMPSQQVVARYQDTNTQVFSTAHDGMVKFSMSATSGYEQKGWQVSTYRADISPYWFNN
ncbi:DNA internalization-related competence protein ComEC/Rec2 [Thalassotalea euphylliae]|uniref:DNA internalization-related competence protein ComEC/Rec2 n=1 Tax=Thalassotalea euphylliae TaxID=1655234 RepID=A0A3E0U6N3_9GAMM|nr:DNA internalization-related competence protein ComEC/Rec2 [Thalassotalea euphylliae]